ncbi:hypothetical protein FPQ18DRAFT_327014 [Pyronema domesticum]|nr:hypothetical protein FPQ18DRAFT_327014 [Pyronema domesticum]
MVLWIPSIPCIRALCYPWPKPLSWAYQYHIHPSIFSYPSKFHTLLLLLLITSASSSNSSSPCSSVSPSAFPLSILPPSSTSSTPPPSPASHAFIQA